MARKSQPENCLRKLSFLLILAFHAAFTHGGVLSAQSTTLGPNAVSVPDFAAIDAYIAREMASERIPGVAFAIVHDNEVVHARGFGTDGTGRKITPQTPFIIGSMSKAFTAFALMQLVDAGRIDLDRPAQHYMPEFRVADSVASARITLRQLLYHASGIPADAPRGAGDSATLPAQVKALSSVQLNSVPGTRHEYSSPNYIVLGAIIERVSGMPFGDYLRSNVFAPLDFTHTYVDQREAIRNGMSRGHRYWFGFPVAATLPFEPGRLPTASIVSSAEDLARFMNAQLNAGTHDGAEVLSADAIAQMHRPGISAEGFSYAMGWRISRNSAGAEVIHHGGIVPHFRGKMVMLPKSTWGVVVLTNASSALPLSPASHRMADNVGAYLAGAPLPAVGVRFKVVYLVISAIVLLLSVNQAKRVIALRRHRSLSRSGKGKWVRMAAGLLIPVALLVALPSLFGMSWLMAIRSMPDLAYWVIAIALADIATRLYSILRLPRTASSQPNP